MNSSKSSKYKKHVYNRHFIQSKDELKINIIKNLIGKPHSKKILDLGCGDGNIIKPFIGDNDCYGIDITENLLKEAALKGIKTILLNLEEETLPFDTSFFDIVLASHILEHITDTDWVLSNINRVIKKGTGSLIISLPNINSLAILATFLLDLPPKYSARYKSPHFRDFTLKLMRRALELNGFKLDIALGTYIYPFKCRFSQYIAKKIPRFADRIIIKATKFGEPQHSPKVVFDVRELMK